MAGSLLSKWFWYKLVRLSTRPGIEIILSILFAVSESLGGMFGERLHKRAGVWLGG
jgi:hypothetical protein